MLAVAMPEVCAVDDVTLTWIRACGGGGQQLLHKGQCRRTCVLLVRVVGAGSAGDLLYLGLTISLFAIQIAYLPFRS